MRPAKAAVTKTERNRAAKIRIYPDRVRRDGGVRPPRRLFHRAAADDAPPAATVLTVARLDRLANDDELDALCTRSGAGV